MNPIITPTVVKFLFSRQASGISSDETTPIIAPAENDKSIGNILLMDIAIKTPKTPAIGSTSPDAWPYKKLFPTEKPSRLKGRDTAAPSGKFWRPIPIAKRIALATVHPGIPKIYLIKL